MKTAFGETACVVYIKGTLIKKQHTFTGCQN